MNWSNKLQNGYCSGIPTQIGSVQSCQNVPKKGPSKPITLNSSKIMELSQGSTIQNKNSNQR